MFLFLVVRTGRNIVAWVVGSAGAMLVRLAFVIKPKPDGRLREIAEELKRKIDEHDDGVFRFSDDDTMQDSKTQGCGDDKDPSAGGTLS